MSVGASTKEVGGAIIYEPMYFGLGFWWCTSIMHASHKKKPAEVSKKGKESHMRVKVKQHQNVGGGQWPRCICCKRIKTLALQSATPNPWSSPTSFIVDTTLEPSLGPMHWVVLLMVVLFTVYGNFGVMVSS